MENRRLLRRVHEEVKQLAEVYDESIEALAAAGINPGGYKEK